MTSNWDDSSFVRRSKYRRDVVRTLASGSAAPSDIAYAHDHAQPHVSHALNELRERDLVELLVPEEQARGRYYGLTDAGRDAWERLSETLFPAAWTRRDPRDDEAALLSLLRTRADDALRTLARSDGDRVAFLYETDALSENREKRLRFLYALASHSAEDRLDYEVFGTDDLTLVRLYPGESGHVTASFDPDYSLCLPDLAEDALSLL